MQHSFYSPKNLNKDPRSKTAVYSEEKLNPQIPLIPPLLKGERNGGPHFLKWERSGGFPFSKGKIPKKLPSLEKRG
jgi:hypothetical protein